MVANASRILLVAQNAPEAAHSIKSLLARPDMRFIISRMDRAVEHIERDNVNAALVLATPQYFNGHQKELIRVLDTLCERHIGTVMLTFNSHDHSLAGKLVNDEGIVAVPHTCSADELVGRIASLSAVKTTIDQLQHENTMLRKFDSGLNRQMTQIDEEMRLAARLQADFLPRNLPQVNGCAFNVLFRPASYVSGDIYDATRLDEDHIGFYIADAVGHGMPAALLTIFIKRTLRTKEFLDSGYRIVPPAEALTHLNAELVSQQLSMCQFVTMAYCILNTQTLELQYARAGHPLPFYLKTDGSATELAVEGPLLGVFPDEKFEQSNIQLSRGDAVLLYSDGFESAFHDPAGEVNERYRAEFAKLAGPNPQARFDAMVEELSSQVGSLHPRDDLTALMLSIS
jgi:sigma-B regulation protein RsbU (phosphoserine phosphatase)